MKNCNILIFSLLFMSEMFLFLQLQDGHLEFIKRNGYNAVVQSLVEETECHSDDEPGERNGQDCFFIHPRRGRSNHVTQFFRWVDEKRHMVQRMKKGARRCHAIPRVEPMDDSKLKKPSLEALPEGVPLDWFDPIFFNEMPAEWRARFADPVEVGLPRKGENKVLAP